MVEPKRIRKKTNMTLSELVKKEGPKLAKLRGMNFSQLVERLVREELVRSGKLPPENLGGAVVHDEKKNVRKKKAKQ